LSEAKPGEADGSILGFAALNPGYRDCASGATEYRIVLPHATAPDLL